MSQSICFTPLDNIPFVQPGDNVAALILAALESAKHSLQDGDVLAIAQKIISKAEGRYARLTEVEPGEQALHVAGVTGKDPRLVELILQESEAISRMGPNLLIVRHRLGFTSANAGIDRSNIKQDEEDPVVLLLPEDPDRSAAAIRDEIGQKSGAEVAVIITDSHGRPFRMGTVGVAIGVAGMPALWDRRGETDLFGYELQHTDVGVADEVAAAAGLLMGQAAEGTPVVHIRGLKLPPLDGTARDLVRPAEQDLYR